MDFRPILISQYLGALEMLKQTILACPDALWFQPDDHNKFSQIAYHTLYYAHMYVGESEQTFQRWSGHRDDYRLAGGGVTGPIAQASKAVVLDYLTFCQNEIAEKVSTLVLDTPARFDWLPAITKFELQLYSLRHIQHHVGELMERLGARAGIELDWIDRGEITRANAIV